MKNSSLSPEDLQSLYANRFAGRHNYRKLVWHELCRFLEQWIPESASVLDLGCGQCEFINAVRCKRKFGMDLNPDSPHLADSGVTIIHQDCSEPWQVPAESLQLVFTSNFFEHLPTKLALQQTIEHAWKSLEPGGRLIAMGPNIKYVPGAYWDFFDHYLALTEMSLKEVLTNCGFDVEICRDRFLPYTMSTGAQYPMWMLRAYLAMPIVWRYFGKQFLLVAVKRSKP